IAIMSPRNKPKNKGVIQKKTITKKTAKHKHAAKRKRNSYSIEQKKQVVAYAKVNGRNKAAAAFKLDRSMVGRWIKASRLWVAKIRQSTKRVGSGRKEFYPEAEKKLYNWIMEQRKQGLGVSYEIARIKMCDILKEPDMTILYGDSIKNFKLSNRWMFA
ncbi:16551_t:CDS:1, partial [Racocetra persica]